MNVHLHIDHLVVDAGVGAPPCTARFEAQLRAALAEQLATRWPSVAPGQWARLQHMPVMTLPLRARPGSLGQRVGQALADGLSDGHTEPSGAGRKSP